MITSPRRIAALFTAHHRSMSSFHNDPMTDACGCSGEINDAMERTFQSRIRKLTGMPFYEATEIMMEFADKRKKHRNRFKNPVQLYFKKMNSERRYHDGMMEAWNSEPVCS